MNYLINKYLGMSIQAKAAIWFAVCSILQKGISFITVPIFTRLLTPEQYGTYSLYLSWLQILTIITSLYLYNGVFNNAMVKFDRDRERCIASMQGLTVTITVCVFVIYISFYRIWSYLLGLSPIIILLMFVEVLLTPALSFWAGKQRFDFQYKKLVVVTLCKSIANPVLGLIAVSLTDDKAVARIVSVVVVEVLFCGAIMIRQFLAGKCFLHFSYWSYALRLAIPLLPHYLSGAILSQSDRIMIDKMIGKSEVAFYSVAYSIGMMVQIITTAISNSFTPWMYQKIKKKDSDGIARTVNMLLVLVGTVDFVLMLCCPELIMIFGSSEYENAVYAIPPIAASVFFIFLYHILAIPQFYYEKTQFLLLSSVFAAAVNLGLNYMFIPLFGYVAAGYTTLICYAIYSFGHYVISQKVLKKFLPGKQIYERKMILLLSSLVILIGIGSNCLFRVWYIRYAIIVIVAGIVFWKRSVILKWLQKR